MASSNSAVMAKARRLLDSARDGDLSLLEEMLHELRREGEAPKSVFERVKATGGKTAFHIAATHGRTQICKFLVEQVQLDPNLKDERGLAPLHYAVGNNHYETSVYIIENCGDLNAVTDKTGRTALHYAVGEGTEELMKLLISKGAKVDAVALGGTPCHYAASMGSKESLQILLDNDADPNMFISLQYHTPLMSSIIGRSVERLKILLKAGADPNARSCLVTPLLLVTSCVCVCVCEGNPEMVECLLNAGADPNATDMIGWTALENAAFHGKQREVEILFPVTSPISSIPDWSIPGVMKHMNSKRTKKQRALQLKRRFRRFKSNADTALSREEYLEAAFWYTQAGLADPEDAVVLSNCSKCFAQLDMGEMALKYALDCLKLRPEWPEAYYRAGVGLQILEHYDEAKKAFYKAWMLDPSSEELERAFGDLVI